MYGYSLTGSGNVSILDINAEYKQIKIRLHKALHAKDFCALCLSTEDLIGLGEDISFQTWEQIHCVTLKDAFVRLFEDKHETLLISDKCCKPCRLRAIKSYIYTVNVERNYELLNQFLKQLDTKVAEVEGAVTESTCNDYANTLITLEDPSNGVFIQDDLEADEISSVKVKFEPTDENDSSEIDFEEDIASQSETDSEDEQNTSKEPKFICDYCKKEFMFKLRLINHIETRHEKKRILSASYCPDCETDDCKHKEFLKPFKNLNGEQKIECPKCKFVCWSKSALIHHANKDHLKIYTFKCNFCTKELCSRMAFNQHIRIFHRTALSCRYCCQKFTKKSSIKRHEKACKLIKREFQCDECQASFHTKEKLKTHKNWHGEIFSCDQCSKIFFNQSKLQMHKMVHDNQVKRNRRLTFICSVCAEEFPTIKERNHHRKQHGKHEKHICRPCDAQFDTLKEYNSHLNKIQHREKTEDNPKKKLFCSFCEYSTNHASAFLLEAHVNRYHLKIAPYKCHHCEKRFTDRAKLKLHLNTHFGQNKLKCNYCEKFFCGPSSLKKHIRLHTGERPYNCSKCSSTFTSSSALNEHKKRHETKTIKCPLCKRLFYSHADMKTHFKNLHWKLKGEKFDINKVKGLKEEDYEMFRDRRLLVLD